MTVTAEPAFGDAPTALGRTGLWDMRLGLDWAPRKPHRGVAAHPMLITTFPSF